MRLLDKLALQKLITLLLNFVLAIVKLFAPKAIEDVDVPENKKPWRPRWRKSK